MNENSIKAICNGYMNKKKGYTSEVHNYEEDTEYISFDIYIMKRGAFSARQPMKIIKGSELTAESQLRSQIARFSALVENGRF